jgi:hypothetical protein
MRNQARFQHRAQIREDQILKTLFGGIVEEQGSQQVAGERSDVVAFKPRAFAGTRKTDGENDYALRRTRACGCSNGNRRRYGRIAGSGWNQWALT